MDALGDATQSLKNPTLWGARGQYPGISHWVNHGRLYHTLPDNPKEAALVASMTGSTQGHATGFPRLPRAILSLSHPHKRTFGWDLPAALQGVV